jgi:hypothetical protein
VAERLDRVEEALSVIVHGGAGDFIDKLISIEKHMGEIAGGIDARLTLIDSSVGSILREVKTLKDKTALLEKRVETEPEKKRKGMLGWMSS